MHRLISVLKKIVASAYRYQGAGKEAQPGVQADIEKFRSLSVEEKSEKPLLYWLLGSGTPDYKMSKDDSAYVAITKTEGQDCLNCEFAYTKTATLDSNDPDIICSQITDRIHANGWCRLWMLADKEERHPY
jgi:hypothetical protein